MLSAMFQRQHCLLQLGDESVYVYYKNPVSLYAVRFTDFIVMNITTRLGNLTGTPTDNRML